MFRIGSMFEGGKSDIPRGCMYAVDINGAVKPFAKRTKR